MFRIDHNFGEIKKQMRTKVTEQTRSATALALNDVAFAARAAVQKEIKSTFKNPKPITINSVLVTKADKSKNIGEMAAIVWIRDELSGGTAPAKYLLTQETGGERANKRMEHAFELKGMLMPGLAVTPGPGAPLDAYGQLLGGGITRIMSLIGALGEQGYAGNATGATQMRIARSARAKARREARLAGAGPAGIKQAGAGAFVPITKASGTNFFPVKSKLSSGVMGIFELVSRGQVRPVLWFTTRKPHYRARFPFQSIVRNVASKEFGPALRRALGINDSVGKY